MDIGRWKTPLISMKVPPEMANQGINGGSSHIDIAGLACSCMKFRQKRFNGENWIQDMATDDDIRCKALGRVLPGRLNQCDIRQALLAGIITQVAQHRSIRFNGSN